MTSHVLDASALLALLQDEPGAATVSSVLASAVTCSVNLSEVVSKLLDKGMPDNEARCTLDSLKLGVQVFDEGLAYETGRLRVDTAGYGLSLGDRACLALARQLKVPALTTDKAWSDLALDGVRVVQIR